MNILQTIQKIWNFIGHGWKKSFSIASYIFAGIATLGGVLDITFKDIYPLSCWTRILIIFFIYIIITFITRLILEKNKTYIIKARKNIIKIKKGDIFKEKGLIVIPFNEYFDTIVDDVIISRNSLNGKFLNNCKIDVKELNNFIKSSKDPMKLSRTKTSRGYKFPLGRIIKYKKYLLLAFSHFNADNVANITRIEYEQCLVTMWQELRRTYNGESIVLPLIGSGITSFTDLPEKLNIDLLKCMICTLKFSKMQFQEDINIVVTEKVWDDLNLVNNITEL